MALSTKELEALLQELGGFVAEKRGKRGIRAAAADAGVSHTTLARIEKGHVPDLETFAKICKWLERDPREFLGLSEIQGTTSQAEKASKVMVHFRKKRTVAPETANALGDLILGAQKAIAASRIAPH